MKVIPLLICRTKYVDYNNPTFCGASDLAGDTIRQLHDVIIKGNNLKYTSECKVFICDNTHIIMGKVMYIHNLGLSIDDSLDKEKDGRRAWGFIGGSIKRSDYITSKVLLDLPENYYIEAYTKCLFEQHWLEERFTGPYFYEPFEVNMVQLEDLAIPFPESDIPIYHSSKNEILLRYAMKRAIGGCMVAFCSNEEFNAAECINSQALDFTTVSEDNLNAQQEAYRRISQKKNAPRYQDNYRVSTNPSKGTTVYPNKNSFEDELKKLCEIYGYRPLPLEERGLVGFYIITGHKEQKEEPCLNPFSRKFWQ